MRKSHDLGVPTPADLDPVDRYDNLHHPPPAPSTPCTVHTLCHVPPAPCTPYATQLQMGQFRVRGQVRQSASCTPCTIHPMSDLVADGPDTGSQTTPLTPRGHRPCRETSKPSSPHHPCPKSFHLVCRPSYFFRSLCPPPVIHRGPTFTSTPSSSTSVLGDRGGGTGPRHGPRHPRSGVVTRVVGDSGVRHTGHTVSVCGPRGLPRPGVGPTTSTLTCVCPCQSLLPLTPHSFPWSDPEPLSTHTPVHTVLPFLPLGHNPSSHVVRTPPTFTRTPDLNGSTPSVRPSPP